MEVKENKLRDCSKRYALILGLGISGGSWQCVDATELGFGAGYVLEHTDNSRRVFAGASGDWVNSVLAGAAFRENGPEVAARAQAQVEYRNYSGDTYQDETLFHLDTSAIWTIRPQRLLWTLEDRYDQVPQDATQALTPSNRENVNVLNTGPDLLFFLTPVDVLVFGARVGSTWFEQSSDDTNRYAGIFRWRHQTNALTNFSLNLEVQKIEFTDVPIPAPPTQRDYLRDDLYLRLDRRLVLSRLVADVGVTRIDPEVGENHEKPLVRFSWAWRLSSESAIGAAVNREYMDVGGSLLSSLADPTAPEPLATSLSIPSTTASGDIFYSKRNEIFYNRTGHYFGMHLGAYQREIDYQTLMQDRIETGSRMQATINFSATWSTNLVGEILKTEYLSTSRLDRDVTYGIQMAYRISRNLSISVEGRHYERMSSEAPSSYSENRGLLGLLYSSNPIFVPMVRR